MSDHLKIAEIACDEVRGLMVEYMEHDLSASLREQIDRHLLSCSHCTAIYDGTCNVVQLVGSHGLIELPAGFSERLFSKLMSRRKG